MSVLINFSISEWGFADVACAELGYGPAELVDRPTRQNLHGAKLSKSSFISQMNPYCNPKTTNELEMCGRNRNLEECGNDDYVFIRCSGKNT